ncbi:ornithine cyclodeaminase family protein [Vibrio europaeus]|uniref:ornithine cyclodeaminase family protein n=1 Tax=Vibrio europaeus TaxID=300876 RepID=UPI00233F05EA|nr:ornithine cyclodeaminase family protein [Vibrio europaeus]MDC5805246.1 ornithine cyclodeaminase family protein [Vibrio europaeus]MDC5826679.1 ornithine cyclodeaminase family protein [Vibrio europaeus]MDC5832045.1 ornithine cyclodeaminase family protein [Vibrio europaeus]MDC5835000.1 ornithine cyclodeaminase family protein [Vibrio europaeus]
MINLDAQQIVNCLSMVGLIESMRLTYQEQATIPQRNVMPLEEDKYDAFALLPAWSESLITVKAFTYFPDNYIEGKDSLASKILAFDRSNGEPLALLDGKVLTYWRTAAASALAADYLANRDAETLLICGTGNLAPYIAYAYSAIRPIRKVLIWGRDEQKARQTLDTISSSNEYQSLANSHQFTLEVIEDVDSVLDQVDIISCVTGSDKPLFSGALIQPGTHIDLIGNHDSDKRECDSTAVQRSSVFVDSRVNVLAEAGDLLIPIEEGVFAAENIQAELADLCRKSHQGRRDEEEITLYKSVGSALADLAAVKFVLQEKEIFN